MRTLPAVPKLENRVETTACDESMDPAEPVLHQHSDAPGPAQPPEQLDAGGGVWRDAMGRAAGRAAQILILGVLAAALVWVMIVVQLAVIAALVALILASALLLILSVVPGLVFGTALR